jgi:hypothetical protein
VLMPLSAEIPAPVRMTMLVIFGCPLLVTPLSQMRGVGASIGGHAVWLTGRSVDVSGEIVHIGG